MDLAFNNLQRLICHKTQPTNVLYLMKSCEKFSVYETRKIYTESSVVCQKYFVQKLSSDFTLFFKLALTHLYKV